MHSKNILAMLLFISIVVTLLGTIAAINTLTPYQQVPLAEGLDEMETGQVSVYLMPSDIETTGKVLVNVQP